MKYSRIIGTIWIIIALYDLYFGLHYLYQYSTPGILWLYTVPIWITFGKIFLGTISLIFGIAIIRKKTNHKYLLIPFVGLLSIYLLIDFLKIGFELINEAGSNLVLLSLALLTIKLTEGFEPSRFKIFRERRTIIFMAIGLTPYFLNSWVSYDWFNFLH